ncbi:hypothetical protein ACFP59_06310, partial [Microbacterium koreense]
MSVYTSARGRLAAVGALSLLLGAGGALITSAPALAAGSDAPTPYTVGTSGITLPDGAVFTDGGHVNVRANQGNRGIHFESRNNQPSGAWIGESFLPWEAFGYDTESVCVEWVQIGDYDEHYGEGGQPPVGNGCEPEVPVDPEVPVEPVDPEVPVEPVDPEVPEVPVEPVDPEVPVEPVDPEVPVEPVDPEVPVEPV